MKNKTDEQIIRGTEKEIIRGLSLLAKSLTTKNNMSLERKLESIQAIGNSVKCLTDLTMLHYKKKKLYEPMHIA